MYCPFQQVHIIAASRLTTATVVSSFSHSALVAVALQVTQAKELDLTARQSPAYQEAMMVLESLHTRIQGPLENVVP